MPIYEHGPVPHYFGDFVRSIFVVIGIIMIVTLPFFQNLVPVNLSITMGAALVLAIIAGLTSPKVIVSILIDLFISISGFIVFEYYAYNNFDHELQFALVNQIIAILFFVAVYYSAKSLRGYFLRN